MTETESPAQVIAFDADVLIYGATPDHPFRDRIRALFESPNVRPLGSSLLRPEVLTKPIRVSAGEELDRLIALFARMELFAADDVVCDTAIAVGAAYKLRAIDAVHLATAVVHGADAYLTNNRKDFRPEVIEEIAVIFPDDPMLGDAQADTIGASPE